jgi:hypothetical protein
MEGRCVAGDRRAGPGMAADMHGILMTFYIVLVFEAAAAVGAFVAFFLFMETEIFVSMVQRVWTKGENYLSSS